MADLPPEMLTADRPEVQEFADEERLFRRFHPDHLDGDEIAIDAVELPNMSVNRERFGPPDWLLLDKSFTAWGVLAFYVRDIPPHRQIWHQGNVPFTLEPRHVPLRYNYPHSEIWVFRASIRIGRENLHLLDPDFHLRWREHIVLASKIVIQPKSMD